MTPSVRQLIRVPLSIHLERRTGSRPGRPRPGTVTVPGGRWGRPLPGSAQVRLITRVARMYHEQGLRQPQIAQRLHISQPRVSRLLRQAADLGIVMTTVVPPRTVFTDLEQAVEDRYGLREVVVVDTGDDEAGEHSLLAALGSAAAAYLDATLLGGDIIGISSWSASLLAVVDAMTPRRIRAADSVIQVLGGVGQAQAQVQASRLTEELATVTGAQPVFFPAPGLVASAATRSALLDDPAVAEVLAACQTLTALLAGVGSLEPSPLLQQSGNAITAADQEQLRRAGAVGDVCLRFFDADGASVPSDLDDRVVGISAGDLLAVPRTIAVAGGRRKLRAVRAAARGKWISVLITDLTTARELADAG